MIDFGFVIAAFVPLVLVWMSVLFSLPLRAHRTAYVYSYSCGENHLRAVWRLALGLGFVPALFVFLWRLRMEEPTRYRKGASSHAFVGSHAADIGHSKMHCGGAYPTCSS